MTPYWMRFDSPYKTRISVPWSDHVLHGLEARTSAMPMKATESAGESARKRKLREAA